jgi:hypothetical protein
MRILCFLLLSFLCFQAARAIDPGQARGVLQIGKETVELKEAFAHLCDNAEGLLDRPKEMRIVLCDREVPQESLRGIAFLPVTELAKEGKVRGLLLEFDPGDLSQMVVTVLKPPSQQGASLMTLTLSETGQKLVKNFSLSQTRVGGEVEHAEKGRADEEVLPSVSYSVKFSAPVFNELPVTADLKGKAAQESPQAKVVREKVAALKKGDFEAVKRLSTERSAKQIDALLAQMGSQAPAIAKEMGAEMEKSLQKIQRVVVRESTAVLIYSGKSWSTFVLVGGVWKSDD